MRSAKPADRVSSTRAEIWDTAYYAPSEARTIFQDAARSAFLPWTSKQLTLLPFSARLESISLDGGLINQVRTVPMQHTRTKADVLNSQDEVFYTSYVISGSLVVEQNGQTNLAREGDLVMFDSALPAVVTNMAASGHPSVQLMGLVIPRAALKPKWHPYFRNRLYPRKTLPVPVSTIHTYISNRLIGAQKDELNSLFKAAVDLLPLVGGKFPEPEEHARGSATAFGRSRTVAVFVEQNLARPTLSASNAARELGLSERYIHKLYAMAGTTFSSYVTARRLECIRADLLATNQRRTPISVIAFKWGFNDLSTFNRAFKSRYGCTPSQLRMLAGT